MPFYPHEKTGQPVSQSLPHRQAEGYMSDDEAVPDTDPSDVSQRYSAVLPKLMAPFIDFRTTPRTTAGLEACLRISRELHLCNGENREGTR